MIKIVLSPGPWRSMPEPTVTFWAGDEIIIGLDAHGQPLIRNLTAERRAKIDEAVRRAAMRRYAHWGPDAVQVTLRTMAATNQVYLGMAAEVAKAWRDVNTPDWERA